MIVINLDVMMAKRKMSLSDLSEKVGITIANLSILKNNKAKAIRFSTLDAICRALDCKVEDILEFKPDEPQQEDENERQSHPSWRLCKRHLPYGERGKTPPRL